MRAEVIDPGLEVRERPAHEVEVDVVEGAGAGGGAIKHLAAGVRGTAKDAGAEVEEARQDPAVERRAVAGRGAGIGDRRERGSRRAA